jgi:C4-dicarboxylate transporter, DctM subunit
VAGLAPDPAGDGILTSLAPVWPLLLVAALLVLRQPLLTILLALAALIHVLWGQGRLEYIAEDIWVALDKELVLSIPMFMLCGQVMTRGGIALRLVTIMRALTPRIPGGLAVACTLSCALDASISGSSIVTMLAIGSVMVPSLLKAGYDRHYALGSVMAGGTLGIIIPPSIPMIVYSLVADASVIDMFKAGIGPGLLLTAALSVYAVWRNRHMPTTPFDGAALRSALIEGAWAVLMPVVLLGGIYGGVLSITESAAVALTYAVVIEIFVYRELTVHELYVAVLDTARIGGALFPIIAIALSLSLLLAEHRVPQQLVQWMQAYVSSPLGFIVAVNLLLLLVGCLLTIDAAILLFAPILVPLAAAYGYHKVLFGIIMILNLEIGFLTPPVGMNLIVAVGAFRQPFPLLCAAALPFVALMLACLFLVIWQPWIALAWR